MLHIVAPGTPGGGACTLRMLSEFQSRTDTTRHAVLLIGTSAHRALATRCGIVPDAFVGAPLRIPALAKRAVHHAMRRLERGRGAFDVVHTWSLGAFLPVARLGVGRPIVVNATVGPIAGVERMLLRRALPASSVSLNVPTVAMQQELCEALERDARALRIHVTAPGIAIDAVDPGNRERLRAEWEVPANALTVGLLSEPASWGDALRAMYVVARARVSGRDVRLVVHSCAVSRVETERWAGRLSMREALIVDDEIDEPWRIFAALDAATVMEPARAGILRMMTGFPDSVVPRLSSSDCSPEIQPILWAMAAGLPVVACATDAMKEIIEHESTGLLVSSTEISEACTAIVRLHDDRTLRKRIGTNARHEVTERFAMDAYCRNLEAAYEELTGRSAGGITEIRSPSDPIASCVGS